jgi:hypothetical protein
LRLLIFVVLLHTLAIPFETYIQTDNRRLRHILLMGRGWCLPTHQSSKYCCSLFRCKPLGLLGMTQ